MTVEKTEEVNQEATEAETAAVIQAAFEQETARIAGVPEPEPKAAEAEEVVTEAPADEPQEVKEPSLADQLAEIRNENKQLRKILDKTSGTHGQDIQWLKGRFERLPAHNSPNLNEVFSRLNIDDPAFADLKTEFPELGGLFVTALKKALVKEEAIKEKAAAEVKTPTTEREIEQEPQVFEAPAGNAAVERMALESLQTKHPDFLGIAKFDAKEVAPGMMSVKWDDPKFGAWLDEMPTDYRESILVGGAADRPTADQILRIADIMTEYKAQLNQEPTEEPVETKTQESKQKPRVDLQKTILPHSRQSNKVALTWEEQVEEAKNAELKKQMQGY